MTDLATLRRACVNWGRYYRLSFEEAEDGAQDVTLRAWCKSVTFPDTKSLYAFARRAMRNWIIDQSRRAESKITGIPYEAWNGRTEPREPAEGALCWLLSQCQDETDRVTLAAMAQEYTAAEQAQSWPGLFPSVKDVYHARRTLRNRLVRTSLLDLSAPDDLSDRSNAHRY